MRVLLLAPASADHVALRAALGAALGATSVDSSHTAEAAVTWVENRPCDLVAIAGAGGSVVESVERLRRASRTLPLLAIVDDLGSREAGAAWLAGADDVLALASMSGGIAVEGLDEVRRQERDALRRTQHVWYAGAQDGIRQELAARLGQRLRDVGLTGEGLAGLTTQDVEAPHAAMLVVNALAAPAALVLGVRLVKRSYPALAITVVADAPSHDAFRRAGADECLAAGADVDHLLHALGRAQSACRRAAELDAVRARETRLRALLENLPEAVVLVSPDHATLAVNLAALRLLGAHDARQVLGTALEPWLEAEDGDAATMAAFVDSITAGNTRDAMLRTRHLADPRRLHVRAVPFQRDSGGRPAALMVLRDVAGMSLAGPVQETTDVEALEAERQRWLDERAAAAIRLETLELELAAARRDAERVAALEADLAAMHAAGATQELLRAELEIGRNELERLRPIESDLRTAAARIGELELALETSRDEAARGTAAAAELELTRAAARRTDDLESELAAAQSRLADTAMALEDARAVAALVPPLRSALEEAQTAAAEVAPLRERIAALERVESEELPVLQALVEQFRAREHAPDTATELDETRRRLADAETRHQHLQLAVTSLEGDNEALRESLRDRQAPETAPPPVVTESMSRSATPVEHHWLLEHVARVGVVVTDRDGRVAEANGRAAELCGFASVEAFLSSGALPAPLLAVSGDDMASPARFELCLQLRPESAPVWVAGARLPAADEDTTATWWLAEAAERPAAIPAHERPETMSEVLEVATAECAALVASVAGRPRGPRPIEIAREHDPAADRRTLGRAQVMLAQLTTMGRRRATAPIALDLSARLLDMAPMLQRLAGDDLHWRLDVPATPVHACLSAADLERCVTAMVGAVRDALPLGGQVSLALDGSGPASFSTEEGVTRADALCVIEAQGYGLTAIDLPASVRELAGRLGATLRVEPLDALTCAIELRLPRAFVVTHAA